MNDLNNNKKTDKKKYLFVYIIFTKMILNELFPYFNHLKLKKSQSFLCKMYVYGSFLLYECFEYG